MPSRSRVSTSSSKNRGGPPRNQNRPASTILEEDFSFPPTSPPASTSTNPQPTSTSASAPTTKAGQGSGSQNSNSKTQSKSSSHHRSRSSFSASLFSSSPSVLWRRGPELESSSPPADMSSEVRQRGSGAVRSKKEGAAAGSSASGARGSASAAERSPRFWQKNYLVAYNLVSGLLWAMVLGRVVLLAPVVGFGHVYGGVGEFAKWVQTGALLEVVHSLTGLVRAPLLTTAMQVASRILLVWGIVDRHPDATSPSPFYSSMLTAWSVTEVIRYFFFVMNLKGGVPRALTWLRYNTFFVLYPLGITSEVAMVWKASIAGEEETARLETYLLWAVLGVYVPGSYVLYTHMMRQRRKVMRAGGPLAAARGRIDSVKGTQYRE